MACRAERRRLEETVKHIVPAMTLCIVLARLLETPAQQPASDVLVRGFCLYGMDNEKNFPVIVRDSVDSEGKPVRSRQFVTIQFDVLADHPPELKLRFLHCDRDWTPSRSVFLQDETHNTSFVLDFRTAPNGVKGYRYRYVNAFPDTEGVVRFDYSGKWKAVLMDKAETRVFDEAKFFVVDRIVAPNISIANEYLTNAPSPWNQVHKVVVSFRLPQEIDGYYYTTVDVFQNRRLSQPYRIDANDRDTYTMVEGYNTGTRSFTIRNIQPGNEYRTLDLSDVTRYPNGAVVRKVEGADQMRVLWRTGPDRNGTAEVNRFHGIHSDYLEVLFRLDLTTMDYLTATRGGRLIFLAGPFNQWDPTPDDQLRYDESEGSYVVRKLLRRGIYDYQYVTGIANIGSDRVAEQDWLSLEGNDWRTSDTYSAVVYFNDPRFGGFDRIVGFTQGRSVFVSPGSQ
jgi:hypothetical protein